MLSDGLIKKLEGIEKCSRQGHKVRNLFNIMTNNPKLWLQAYANIYPNKGALTEGIDKITVDGFCEDRVANTIKLLKEGRYQCKPSRRTYIRKSNGKQRPLGIQSGDDKLVQEVVRLLLERVYEPVFTETSHGFRTGRSCHTALDEIRKVWTGARWLINVDVAGYFDNIDHRILVNLLEQKIDDQKFIRLIKSMLHAGYLEDWQYHRTYSGTPQGSGCSPILANAYLHELDKFMEEIKASFDQGKKRRGNPEYQLLSRQIREYRRAIDVLGSTSAEAQELKDRIKQLDRQRKSMPSGDTQDPHYKRVHYVRYADDSLIGIIGSHAEAEQMMAQVKEFLRNKLNLPIAEEKSTVAHAQKGMIFLGHEVRSFSSDKEKKVTIGGRHTKMRTIKQNIDLYVPEERIKKFSQARGYGNYDRLESKHRLELLSLSDYEIIGTYNAELRGLANYYALAKDTKQKLSRLEYLTQGSLVKTLANKHQTKVTKIALGLKRGEDYVHRCTINDKVKEIKVFKLKDLNLQPKTWEKIDQLPNTYVYAGRTEILERLAAEICEYCGKEDGYFEVHHVRKLADLKDGKEKWQKQMSARRRKTMVLCVECHDLLHAGILPSWRASMYERSGEPCAFKEASTVRRGAHACTLEV
jgi:group II intron reverse transcriptase/maturase